MVQRFALLIGGLGAAAVLAFALGLTNFVFAGPSATAAPAADQSNSQAQADTGTKGGTHQGANQNNQPQTKTVVDKVYVAPPQPNNNPQPNQAAPANNPPAAQQPAAAPPQSQAPAPAPRTTRHHGEREGGD